jgi:hypothetical protein
MVLLPWPPILLLPLGVLRLITSYQLTIKKVLLHGAIAIAPHPPPAQCPQVNHQLSTHHQEGAAPWYHCHVPPILLLPIGVPGLITNCKLTIKKVLFHGAIAMSPHPLAAHGCPRVAVGGH